MIGHTVNPKGLQTGRVAVEVFDAPRDRSAVLLTITNAAGTKRIRIPADEFHAAVAKLSRPKVGPAVAGEYCQLCDDPIAEGETVTRRPGNRVRHARCE